MDSPGVIFDMDGAGELLHALHEAGMAAVAITGTAPRAKLAPRAHVVIGSLRELTPARLQALIESAGRGRASAN